MFDTGSADLGVGTDDRLRHLGLEQSFDLHNSDVNAKLASMPTSMSTHSMLVVAC